MDNVVDNHWIEMWTLPHTVYPQVMGESFPQIKVS